VVIIEGYKQIDYSQLGKVQYLINMIINAYRGGLKAVTFSPITSKEKDNAYAAMATVIGLGGFFAPDQVMNKDIGANYFIRLEAEVTKNIYEEYSDESFTIDDTYKLGKSAKFRYFIGYLKNIVPNTNLPVIIHYSGHGKLENGVPKIDFWETTSKRKFYSPRDIASQIRKKSLTNVLVVYLDACYSAYNPSSSDETISFKALFINYAGALYFIGSRGKVHSAFAQDLATYFIADLIHKKKIGSSQLISKIFRSMKAKVYNEWMDHVEWFEKASDFYLHSAVEIAQHIIEYVEIATVVPYALIVILAIIAGLLSGALYYYYWGSYMKNAARRSYNNMQIYYLHDVPPGWSPS